MARENALKRSKPKGRKKMILAWNEAMCDRSTRKSLLLALFLLLPAAIAATRCRCTADQSCFPNAKHWERFNLTVGGALIQVRPPASPCYDADGTAQCATARANWHDSAWRSTQVEHPNWEAYGTQSCPLPPNGTALPSASSCSQVLAVNVSSISQVQAAIHFARQHFLRIVVKSTGHDYLGRSFARGSLSIWTHNLKSIQFSEEFVEEGCDPHSSGASAVEVGAGVQWRELYTAAHAQGKLVVGALSSSVATAGGYVQGGGHSPAAYGLAADNVLQFTIVTPGGTVRYANRCVNRDLFWALRGGGGGTFGVVTAAVHRTFPAPSNILSAVHVLAASGVGSYRQLIGQFTQLSAALYRQGWAGYFVMGGTSLTLRYHALNQTTAFHDQSFGSFLEWIARHNATVRAVGGGVRSYPSFLEWYNDTMCSFYPSARGICNDDLGTNRVLISRLVPASAIESSGGEISDALVTLLQSNATSNAILGVAVSGGAAVAGAGDAVAVNPAWRQALWHITAESSWDDSSSFASPSSSNSSSSPSSSSPSSLDSPAIGASIRERMDRLTAANAQLRDLTPGSWAYFNEADYNEPDWQQSLFGNNYQRLLTVKTQVDPRGLLVCWQHWSTDLNCPASS
ncbi:uncharacterized FAD-linked oxidoreductase ARB_02478 [Selaginella moellendorffii]|uniref:uncharacterized FAD-linked oxidoreductase ARB_02478 n=1 Tax=Selaginella moellendorffii TaxID=88036 RepID=UPI000D1D02CA|nr:uncharacterized FAD-linked oxidoreductase ARB_02478 [Selaginella moellendorffii]|eukprot:XP_024538396.1 uncharacterized FAD-linked oxidoreductase ARB_02478 [Selaginella moellendorffii]